MKDEVGIVIQKIQDIFRANRLNRMEIIALLHTGDLDYGDERFDHAACQISGLLLQERVSIEEAARIFDACYRLQIIS
jgi:hypothetical protein